MPKQTDVSVKDAELYFLPVRTRVPLKFGPETLTYVTCARSCMKVEDRNGKSACGWGETPLSVQWVWPGHLGYDVRHEALKKFCVILLKEWRRFETQGHPMEIGHTFIKEKLPELLNDFNNNRKDDEQMPYLAALVCCSVFDIALHDAYGVVHNIPTYETYNSRFMNRDLSSYLSPADGEAQAHGEAQADGEVPADGKVPAHGEAQADGETPDRKQAPHGGAIPAGRKTSSYRSAVSFKSSCGSAVSFNGKYPSDYLVFPRPSKLPAWHLVGGKDLVDESELTGTEPDDGYPVLLRDWIKRDGLTCLKVKLRGNDGTWDYNRLVMVGRIAEDLGVLWLTSDFNCTVTDPGYVNRILDRLKIEEPHIYGMILYVEQPFPYDLEKHQIDVHSVSARKPLFMDESAHNWRLIKLGRHLGWTGVALKTCKTQTGALLSLCWAKAHGMTLMVQDLTNPMLAQVPHVLLAAHAGTIMGVETNAMQFYPEASSDEAKVHPGIFTRTNGTVDLSSLNGPGFGYRIDEINRNLPETVVE